MKQPKTPYRKLADVLVFVLHPALLFAWFFLLFGYHLPEFGWAFLIVFLGTFILPVATTYAVVPDFFLKDRRDRPLPLMVTIACYGMAWVALKTWFPWEVYLQYRPLLTAMATIGFMLVVLFLVTLLYKVSLHGFGIGSLLGGLAVMAAMAPSPLVAQVHSNLLSAALLWLFLLFASALVLWQRVDCCAHTKAELAGGTLIGLAGMPLLFWLIS